MPLAPVLMPLRVIFALLVFSEMMVAREPPLTTAFRDERAPTVTRNFVSERVLPPALKRRPPVWFSVPAYVRGSSDEPDGATAKVSPLLLLFAGLTSDTAILFAVSTFAVPASSLSMVWPLATAALVSDWA